jgi:16S rRNA (cytosine1402-N4)-methyltransferase
MHTSVLLDEVIHALGEPQHGLYVDATFGAGGYTRALLGRGEARIIGIDRDPTVERFVEPIVRAYPKRFIFARSAFSALGDVLAQIGVKSVDGVMMDIGVSSMQIDREERGFSFLREGPLDMRMSGDGVSAADAVNALDEEALANILYVYGEERQSRRIAKVIADRRASHSIETTSQLAELVIQAIGEQKKSKVHAATKTFQALRIYVNDELGELERALHAAEAALKPGGRLVVVSFHSLEDRLVKAFLTERSGRSQARSRHLPPATDPAQPSLRLLHGGAIKASDEEIAANPRARSARLRAAERTTEPIEQGLLSLFERPLAPSLEELAR